MDDFISEADNKLKFILSELGWSMESFSKSGEENFVTCKKNPGHRILQSNLSEHHERCNSVTAAARFKEHTFSPCLEEGPSTFKMTPELQEKIISNAAASDPEFIIGQRGEQPRPVPESSDELLQMFTRDERRAIYDHVIANTQRQVVIRHDDLSLRADLGTETKREMTALELAAAERDAKRRRATYRNKVHTNKKTHTEIMKEVIESQMTQMLEVPPKNQPDDDRTTDEMDPKRKEQQPPISRCSHEDSGSRRKSDECFGHGRDRIKTCRGREWEKDRSSESRRQEKSSEGRRGSKREHSRERRYDRERSRHHDRERRDHGRQVSHRHTEERREYHNKRHSEEKTYHHKNSGKADNSQGKQGNEHTELVKLATDRTENEWSKESSDESKSVKAKKAKKKKKEHKHKKSKKRKHKKKAGSSSSESSS